MAGRTTNLSTYRLAVASCAMGLLAYAGLMSLVPADDATAGPPGAAPQVLELTGTVRDFRERTDPGGHPDFEVIPDHGYGHYIGNVAPYLTPEARPFFTGQGRLLVHQWRDAEGRPICWRVAQQHPAPGDQPGEVGPLDTGGIESGESFSQWYRDVPGVNMSEALTLTLVRQGDGTYVFDDQLDPVYSDLDGFFPIEDRLFGNPGGTPDRNFHFTFELHAQFVYDEDAEQIFRFVGDDDVWVFINGELVIDLGGVHAAVEQYVDLERLDLVDGETYPLDFYFAERHRTQSNFRIVTTLQLESTDPPTITAIFD